MLMRDLPASLNELRALRVRCTLAAPSSGPSSSSIALLLTAAMSASSSAARPGAEAVRAMVAAEAPGRRPVATADFAKRAGSSCKGKWCSASDSGEGGASVSDVGLSSMST